MKNNTNDIYTKNTDEINGKMNIIKSASLTPAGSELIKSEEAAKPVIKTKIRTQAVRSKRKIAFPVGIVFMVVVFTLLLMMCVSNYVALNEYTRDISELKEELSDLKTEEKKLNGELDKKNDLIEIEKYATDKLGMVNSNNVEKKYIEVTEDEKIEVYEVEEDGTMEQIASALFALTGNLINSWNTFMGNE